MSTIAAVPSAPELTDLPVRTYADLALLADRIADFTDSPLSLWQLREGELPPVPNTHDEFVAEFLRKNEIDVRIYRDARHKPAVVVPLEYVKSLDEVRELRLRANSSAVGDAPAGNSTISVEDARQQLAAHPYRNRLLPEEAFAYLDELPDSSYFTQILLLDWPNPEDVWLRKQYNSTTFTSAAGVMPTGELELYRTENNEFVRVNLCHEWSHQLRTRNEADAGAFNDALEMEWRIYLVNNNTYALTSYSEHHAVFGEEMLHQRKDRFVTAAERAPIRTCVWMRSLSKALSQIPEEARNDFHKALTARCEWVQQLILPKANELLDEALRRATNVRDFVGQS